MNILSVEYEGIKFTQQCSCRGIRGPEADTSLVFADDHVAKVVKIRCKCGRYYSPTREEVLSSEVVQ